MPRAITNGYGQSVTISARPQHATDVLDNIFIVRQHAWHAQRDRPTVLLNLSVTLSNASIVSEQLIS